MNAYNPINYDKNTRNALAAVLMTDSYKLSHGDMYPENTSLVYSNFTARGTRVPNLTHTVFFGLQACLKKLNDTWQPFFDADIDEVVSAYKERMRDFLGTDVKVERLRKLHAIGHLPFEFRALPEGSLVPFKVPYFTWNNTHLDMDTFWLTNYIETELSASVWLPITSATTAWRTRLLLDSRAQQSGVDKSVVDFQGHDFSARGMSDLSDAASKSAAGHLLSFRGTDSLPALDWIDNYYPLNDYNEDYLIAASVPASEHSVMTAGGVDGEFDMFVRVLDQFPTGIVSVVSDSYNLWRVLTDFMPRLKDKIISRDGRLVIRPDSGDPETILCGDRNAPEGSPENMGVIKLLDKTFGSEINAAGFRELNTHVGAIYGDGITYERTDDITKRLISQGYVSTSSVLGYGSFTYQSVTRDTHKMAAKATYLEVDGKGYNNFKDPITDDGTKKSAKGLLAVRKDAEGEFYLAQEQSWDEVEDSELRVVYRDGQIIGAQTFKQVRENLDLNTAELKERIGLRIMRGEM